MTYSSRNAPGVKRFPSDSGEIAAESPRVGPPAARHGTELNDCYRDE